MLNDTLNYNRAFYEILRGGLWENDVQLASFNKIDYSELYRLSEEQSVLGLIAAGIEHIKDVKIPQDEKLKFVGTAIQLEQQNIAMNHFIEIIVGKMRDANIYTLLLKGQGIAQCYERPLWRTCGDIDFFLDESNYNDAKNLLKPLASFIDIEGKYNKHLEMTIDSWVVELHGNLRCGLSSRIDKVLDEIYDDTFYGGKVRSWMNGNTQMFLLGANSDAIYVFTHFLNHFYKGGLGLRQVCDWCRLLWTYKDALNFKLLERRIREMGLMSEWMSFGAFAVEYLGMPSEAMPFYSADKKWKKKADKICDFIMEVGNMGHNRDMSYFNDKSYFMQKVISLNRRCGDLWRHAKIFPMDSLKFFPQIMLMGLSAATRGE